MVNNGGSELGDLSFIKDFHFVVFNYVNRECNKLADLCANYACISSFIWDDLVMNKIPPSFINLLKEESNAIRM
ncbi:hypothetical protein MA16_Dca004122 [Dendrobium catenatum]|uniref:RNase H type-1 domain-containing protein n=1 Tax=Dendrobium catenatum TaxID=906689 RepID=A0A2I0X2H2_9ASPA|nr:hypothetical protein MA16_Dca004122 [Dendrobium catenatum]